MSNSKFDEIMRQMRESIARMGDIQEQTFSVQNTETTRVDIRSPGDIGTSAGLEINIDDMVLADGVFTYQGVRVLLFIPDHSFRLPEKLNGEIEGNKYHLTDCRTLQQMKANNRYNRYFATHNTEGIFKIHGTIDGVAREAETELFVCKNCLTQLNYHDYDNNRNKRNQVYQHFNLGEFFAEYESTISEMPPYVGQNQPDYAANWNEISLELRRNQNWTCQECRVNLSGHRGLLHVHHIDGVRQHNVLSNLKVLCLECHSNQPNHEHMKNMKNYQANIAKIQKLRGR